MLSLAQHDRWPLVSALASRESIITATPAGSSCASRCRAQDIFQPVVPDVELESALQAERLHQHARTLKSSVLGSASVGLLLALALRDMATPWALLSWLAALAASLGLRWAAVQAQSRAGTADPERWLVRHRVAFLLHGLAWVGVLWVLGELPPGSEADLMLFALCIVTAGTLTTASFDVRTALCFALPTLGAGLALALHTQNIGALTLAAMAGVFLLITAVAARHTQRLVRESVRLRLTENTRAEEATQRLASQHRLMGQLLQTTAQGFWFIDTEARTTEVNPAMARLLGLPPEAMAGRVVFDFVAPEDHARLRAELAQQPKPDAAPCELGLQRADGSRVHCVCSATPLLGDAGTRVGAVVVWTDISERRQSEAALRDYELAVNAISDVVSVVGRDERYLLVNDAWCRAARATRDQALGRLPSEALPNRVTEKRLRTLRDCMASGEVRSSRGPDPRASRPNCIIETHYFPQKDASGQVQRVVMVTRDITEQERSRDALTASEAVQRALLDNFPGFISRLDSQGNYTFVNQRLATLIGRRTEEIVGRHIGEVLGTARAAELQPLIDRALSGEDVSYEYQRQPAAGGDPLELQVRMVAGVDPLSGEPVVYGFTLDITQRKRAEAALRENSAELGALLAAFPGYIGATDEQMRYTYLNPRLLEALGRNADDVLGRTLREVMGEERGAPMEAAVAAARRGEHSVAESVFERPGRKRLVLEITRVTGPRQPDGRQTCYGFGVDITARKQAEVALIAARDEAESANRAKSQFLSQMSHELRTPLNAVLGFGQLLESDVRATLVPHHQAWLQEMLRGAEHLLSLINEVLDLGRIEAGDLPLELQLLMPAELVDESLALVQALAQSLGVTLHASPDGLHEVQVRADRRRLKQVLLNLLGNAIKYNRPGGEVAVLWRVESGELWLGVRDTGRGLSTEEQAKLFQPFERLGAAQSGIEGTGIGLAISRRLIEAMGGHIGVQSVPGEGSTFWLRLPCNGAAAAPALPAPDLAPGEADAARAGLTPRRVLYIEDNPVNVVLMEAMLARLPNVQLFCAATPTEGLRLATLHTPALVLLDIHLPEMDGFAVLQRLRQQPSTATVPVVAVSANALQEDITAAHAAGFAAYLTKPLSLDTLLATVREQLR